MMRIDVLDNNLMFANRLRRALEHLGYQARMFDHADALLSSGVLPEVALVNVGNPRFSGLEIVFKLKEARVPCIIGFAGHREKEIHQKAKEAGCTLTGTNREVTHRLLPLIQRALSKKSQNLT